MNASQVIKRLGGTAAVARLCEVKAPSVSEWKRVGKIPRAREQYLRLLKPEAFDANDIKPAKKIKQES